MKKGIYFIIVIFLIGCSSEETLEKTQLIMEIEGMSCSHSCSPFIQKKLSSTEGVESAKVNFDKQLATVVINHQVVSKKSIIEKIQSLSDGQYKIKSCKSTLLKNSINRKSSLESKSDFDITQPEVSPSEFKLPNFFKILNILLN